MSAIEMSEVEQRFWARVDRGPIEQCWPWTGSVNTRSGYGQFHPARERTVLAHRFAYESAVDTVPDDMVIDHVKARGCDGGRCCNPSHLEPVEQAENIRRGALGFGDGYCRSGRHDVTQQGAIEVRANGKRRCVQCRRDAARRRHEHRRDQL